MNKNNVINVDGEEIAKNLIGKSIIKVERKKVEDDYGYKIDGYILYCKDGIKLEIGENEGCGGCSNGWSEIDLMSLNENDNMITNAEYKRGNGTENYKYDDDAFTIFIYYQDNKINVINGTDGYGNGFYGGGFYLNIKSIKGEEDE